MPAADRFHAMTLQAGDRDSGAPSLCAPEEMGYLVLLQVHPVEILAEIADTMNVRRIASESKSIRIRRGKACSAPHCRLSRKAAAAASGASTAEARVAAQRTVNGAAKLPGPVTTASIAATPKIRIGT